MDGVLGYVQYAISSYRSICIRLPILLAFCRCVAFLGLCLWGGVLGLCRSILVLLVWLFLFGGCRSDFELDPVVWEWFGPVLSAYLSDAFYYWRASFDCDVWVVFLGLVV